MSVVSVLALLLLAAVAVPPAAEYLLWDRVVEGRSPAPEDGDLARVSRVEPPALTGADVQLMTADLSGADLSASGDVLSKYTGFTTLTRWPASLPAGFDPAARLELGKNPGLGIRALHAAGITGKGVRVAYIDATPLLEHQEYAGRVVRYVEMSSLTSQAEWHGPAVISLAIGKTVGVAPEAEMVYYRVPYSLWRITGQVKTVRYIARAINRILDENAGLPAGQRIRVIGSSQVFTWELIDGGPELLMAVERAKQEGVLVVSTDMAKYYTRSLGPVGRDPMGNADRLESYGIPVSWEAEVLAGQDDVVKDTLVPVDSRTMASPTGLADYRFDRAGGASWSAPWFTGFYALVLQVNPQVDPVEFLEVAYQTGQYVTDRGVRVGPIINPAAVIAHFRR
ncbi:MAG TPA: hypothetical protein VNT75_20280 [Symbiobacteriaceae bacterium]|nr:hypothetical protein [Symbiobacteriaceae bacterium]